MTKKRETVLVTGGAGFIGSHVVERLIRSGCRVINLDLLTYAGNLANLESIAGNDRHLFVQGNICDAPLVAKLLSTHQPGAILNIAAETHVDRSIDDASVFLKTNIEGTYRMLEAALAYWCELPEASRAGFRFIQMSTDEVYGSIAVGKFTEESNYAPNSPYAASKAAGDHLVRAYHITYGLPAGVVHASNTYGPRQYPEKLIPHMFLAAMNGRSLPVYGEGKNVRDWMHVHDLAAGLERVVERGLTGETYNFAGGNERRNIDTVRLICSHLARLSPSPRDYEKSITFVTDRPGHDLRYAMSNTKVERELGWRPSNHFEDGLSDTIKWYLKNMDWCSAVLNRGYESVRIGTRQ
jgi:dTDP-glucose 4,6-dehydratase